MSEDDYIMILLNLIQLINFVMWSAVQTPNKSRHVRKYMVRQRLYNAKVTTHIRVETNENLVHYVGFLQTRLCPWQIHWNLCILLYF